ncbi:hypothetical protein [Planctomycetes bacterium TBK1r]|uniref:Uncharacterized protein n=1 Tax=Stieleria magnilauensis TaxID=2527963 RepID=A0ABX5XPM3_9BACT|nr:hypothetical protein TBK1r_22380 [Planctomycetes bacterium TBK1r]
MSEKRNIVPPPVEWDGGEVEPPSVISESQTVMDNRLTPVIDVSGRRNVVRRQRPRQMQWNLRSTGVALLAVVFLGMMYASQRSSIQVAMSNATWHKAHTYDHDFICVTVNVSNRSRETIKECFFVIEQIQPGREVPHKSSIVYADISGGIEPGETRTVKACCRWLEVFDVSYRGLRPNHVVRVSITGGETINRSFEVDEAMTAKAVSNPAPRIDPEMADFFGIKAD